MEINIFKIMRAMGMGAISSIFHYEYEHCRTSQKVGVIVPQNQPEGVIGETMNQQKKSKKKRNKTISKAVELLKEPSLKGLVFGDPFKDLHGAGMGRRVLSSEDPFIPSVGVVLKEYFGEYVLSQSEVEEVVDAVNTMDCYEWWEIGYCLASKLQRANYNKSGMVHVSIEGYDEKIEKIIHE